MIKILALLLFTEQSILKKNNIIENMNLKMVGLDMKRSPEEHHDHLIDIRNGKVMEFQNDEIENLQKGLQRNLDMN